MVTEASSSSLVWQYFGAFLGYAGVVVALLIGGAYALKKNPKLMGWLNIRLAQATASSVSTPQLAIEEALPLEPQKTLYVVRYGYEKFLVAAGVSETQFLTRLGGGMPAGAAHALADELAAAGMVAGNAVTHAMHQSPTHPEPIHPSAAGTGSGSGPQFFQTLRDSLPKKFVDQTVPTVQRPGQRAHHDHPAS